MEAMIRREAAREFRGRLPYAGKIEVLLVGPLPDLGDVGVVDLDFVMDLVDSQRGPGCGHKDYSGAGSDKPGSPKAQFQISLHSHIMRSKPQL